MVTQPTTQQEGSESRSCSRCGAVESRTIPQLEEPSLEWSDLDLNRAMAVGNQYAASKYAAANDILSKMPDKQIIYKKAEQFAEELVAALLNDTLETFKEQYLKADVLLMDDLQYILDKPSTLEELRRLFGSMLQQKKQVVIAANPGSGSRTTLKQLQDSFDTGFAVEIAPPDREMRMALVQAEAEKYDLPLTEEAIACLADRLTCSLGRIRRGMKKICADHICNEMELGLEDIAGVVSEL